MTARNTDILAAVEEHAEVNRLWQQKKDSFIDDMRTKQLEIESRLEEIETGNCKPGRTAGSGNEREQQDHVKAFTRWMKRPDNSTRKTELENIEAHLASKAATIATPSSGGYAVPEILLRQIERFEKALSPVRDLVKVVQIGTGDAKTLVNLRGATAGWSSESGSRTATETSELREVVFTGGELYAYPQASEWLIDDSFFNVEGWLAEEVGAELLGDAVIRGDGSNKPSGMITDPPEARDDFDSPIRDADTYQYVNADDVSPFAVSGDGLISLVYKVKTAYRANGTFVMNSATAAAVRKLKMMDRYLWTDSLAAGQPATLLGYPVAIWEQMDDIDVSGGSNPSFPIAFGDFRRAYTLADRTDMRITVDQYTTPGQRKFYVRRRIYGAPTNTNSVKFLRTAA